MFLHLSVILFTRGCLGPGRGCLGPGLGGDCPGGCPGPGGCLPRGGCPGLGGPGLGPGGFQAQAQAQRGVCVSQDALRQTPPPPADGYWNAFLFSLLGPWTKEVSCCSFLMFKSRGYYNYSNCFDSLQAAGGVCLLYAVWPNLLTGQIVAVYVVVILVFLPASILIFVYGRIAWVLSMKANRDVISDINRGGNKDKIVDTSTELRMKNYELAKRNMIKTLVTVAACFIICWMGNQVWFLLYNIGYEIQFDSVGYQFTVLMVCVNSTVNPFIYLVQYKEYQEALKTLACKKRSSSNNWIKHTLQIRIFTARNEAGARLCFYTCLWFCSQEEGVLSQHVLQVVSQHALQVSRPTPRGEVEGSGWGGLQAHTPGVSRPIPRGSPGPHPGGCIPACTEADPPMATAVGSTHPTGMHACYVTNFVFFRVEWLFFTMIFSRWKIQHFFLHRQNH